MPKARRFGLVLAAVAALALAAHAQPTAELPPVEVEPGAAKPNPAEPETTPISADAKGAGTSQPMTSEPAGKAAAPLAGWNDTFFFRSADDRFSLRITGQVQADYRNFLDRTDATDVDSFFVRRARFGLEATLFKYYEFRFLPEFGQGQSRLVDGYLNVHYWDAFQFTAGKFKQPFSYEQLIQDRFTPFMERSLIDQLVPARDAGVMVHGQNLLDGVLDYGFATSNGVQNGDTDTNGAKDVTARLAARPFAWWEGSPLRRFQLGAAVDVGNQNEVINPQTLRTPAGVPYFQFNRGVIADGRRSRWSPEVAYFVGGFGFSAQYFRMEQRMRPAAVGAASAVSVNVPFDGYYVQATYLLTGEERTGYSQAISPRRPFDPRCQTFGPGAWEVVGRVSRLRVGDVVFAPGLARLADPAAVSDEATEMTLGFNWYLNRWVRAQFNWEHVWFGRAVRLGPGPQGLFLDHDTIQARLQFFF